MRLVYCARCGEVIGEDEFLQARARIIDNLPVCERCAGRSLKQGMRPFAAPRRRLLRRRLNGY